MSKLSNRVQKAKKLRVIPSVDGDKGCYNAYGGSSGGTLYEICLKSGMKNIATPDGYRPTRIIYTSCQKSTVSPNSAYSKDCQHCKGNIRHTVCYHCLAAIWFSFKYAGFQVSFFETYHSAVNGLNFGGALAKIENSNHTGAVWCVYRKADDEKKKVKFIAVLPEQEANCGR